MVIKLSKQTPIFLAESEALTRSVPAQMDLAWASGGDEQ